MTGDLPRLSACILARSSRAGLGRLLDQIDAFADEIVIGVDSASSDDTLAIARRRADVVFRFEHAGPPVRARLLILEHAHGDWVLSLDEDEGLDEAFAPLLPGLLSQPRYTHYWLPRKWIVEQQPLAYLHCGPWFPDWQLRLFRNDPRRVWHPGVVHSGYRVMGAGCREDRTSILHYEAVVLDPEEREAKVEYYRRHGSQGRSEAMYGPTRGRERRRVAPGPAATSPGRAAPRAGRVITGVLPVPPAPARPPWRASLDVEMAREAVAGASVLADVTARNTGRLAWEPFGAWPLLHLSYHVRRPDGEVVRRDGERFNVPRAVEPGESARFLLDFPAPGDPGEYVIEWDLVSEGECWFADCGSETARAFLRVVESRG
jgi:hypothetical protein